VRCPILLNKRPFVKLDTHQTLQTPSERIISIIVFNLVPHRLSLQTPNGRIVSIMMFDIVPHRLGL